MGASGASRLEMIGAGEDRGRLEFHRFNDTNEIHEREEIDDNRD